VNIRVINSRVYSTERTRFEQTTEPTQ
jgi:hypothetical protein